MNPPPFEVADIVRAAGKSFAEKNRSRLSWQHLRVLRAIERCRTAKLGGHLDQCSRRGHQAMIGVKYFFLSYCLSDGCYRRVNVRGKARYAVESQAEDRHLRCSVKQSPP